MLTSVTDHYSCLFQKISFGGKGRERDLEHLGQKKKYFTNI